MNVICGAVFVQTYKQQQRQHQNLAQKYSSTHQFLWPVEHQQLPKKKRKRRKNSARKAAHTHTLIHTHTHLQTYTFSQHTKLLNRPPVILPTTSVTTQPAGRLGKARFDSASPSYLSHQHNIVQDERPNLHVFLLANMQCYNTVHSAPLENGEDCRKTAVMKKIDCTDLSGRVRAQRAAIWHTARQGSLVIRLQRAPCRGQKIVECTFPCNRRKHSIMLL